jgi:putative transcriptional regulator
MPQPLAEYVGGSLKDVKWRSLGMGTKQAILKTSKNATARLLYIPAGVEMPDHGHKGIEMTLVLQGAFIDGSQRFARGDIEIVDEHMEHTPVADIGEDCICLVASNAPLKFRGLMPRLAQVFLRI